MITQIWMFQVVIAVVAAVPGNEVLPERYLKPRDFNHHPYTDVGIPAALKRQTTLSSPFAVLAKLRPRKADEYSEGNLIFYPVPHASVVPKKIQENEIPKNYAFTYTVKDHLSGDDFSHSQAHNGKATKGQYRVKLPDGRTQIVSYTADHKGYRADVQYEDKPPEKSYPDALFKPAQILAQVNLPENFQQALRDYQNEYLTKYQYVPVRSATVQPPAPAGKSEQVNYITPATSPSDLQVDSESNSLKILLNHQGNPTVVPYQGKATYLAKYLSSEYQRPQYVASTSAPAYEEKFASPKTSPQYVSTTPAPQYLAHVPSTALYPVQELTASTVNDKNTYPTGYGVPSTTADPHQEVAVLVTPRPVYEPHVETKLESSLLYRLVK